MSYSLSFIFHVVLLMLLIYHFKRELILGKLQVRSAKNRFSYVYAVVAILISTFGYEYVALAYEFYGVSINHGHAGIAYLTSGLFNMAIGFVGVIFGRIIIGWKRIEL